MVTQCSSYVPINFKWWDRSFRDHSNIPHTLEVKNLPVSRATYTILSGSTAHAPTAFVTFTRSAWFIPTRRFTRGWMPPHLRTMTRFSCSWQHSPKAPTTFTRTSSGWSVKRPTSVSMALYSRNLKVRERRLFTVQSWQKRYSEK